MFISLTYNKGYSWKKKGRTYFKGYVASCEQEKIFDQFNAVKDFEDFKERVMTLQGCFAIVVDAKDKIFMAVDNARSIPLFYTLVQSIVSDNVQDILTLSEIKNSTPDPENLIDYVYKRNSSPSETVYKEICQLKAGECAQIDALGNILIDSHFSHYAMHDETKGNLNTKFYQAIDEMMTRLMYTLPKDKRIVIPLSGGYDSRFLVCLLKEYGFHNILCYTYGVSNNYEVINSRKVAETLGFEWYYVKYDREKWRKFFSNQSVIKGYFFDCSNDCALPHIQEYLAIEELTQKRIIKKGDVVIPGFCGDFPAGSYTRGVAYSTYDLTQLIKHIIKEHYINFPLNNYTQNIIEKKLHRYFEKNKIVVKDRDSFIAAYEEWTTCSRLSMWVVNSLRVYEHFGLQWRLPMWDKSYLNFWYSIPNDLRRDCSWYQQFIFTEFFDKYGVTMKKPAPSTLHVNKIKSLIVNIVKRCLIYLSAKTGKDYYRRNNINDYNDASLIMISQLRNKSLLTYSTLSAHLIEQIWWTEIKYEGIDLARLLKGVVHNAS